MTLISCQKGCFLVFFCVLFFIRQEHSIFKAPYFLVFGPCFPSVHLIHRRFREYIYYTTTRGFSPKKIFLRSKFVGQKVDFGSKKSIWAPGEKNMKFSLKSRFLLVRFLPFSPKGSSNPKISRFSSRAKNRFFDYYYTV